MNLTSLVFARKEHFPQTEYVEILGQVGQGTQVLAYAVTDFGDKFGELETRGTSVEHARTKLREARNETGQS